MTGPVVETRGLRKSYGDVEALCGVDLTVQRGTVYGAARPQRRRKTTAVRILTTLLPPDGGTRSGRRARRGRRRRTSCASRIGLAGQYAAVDENLTGAENLEMVGRLYHRPPARPADRARELLERFELDDAGRPPREDLFRRHAPPARPGGGTRRSPAGDLPRRADDWPRPAQPDRALGGDRAPSRRRDDGPADDPVPRRGRPPGRSDRRDRPRPGDRRGNLRASSSSGLAASGWRSRSRTRRTSRRRSSALATLARERPVGGGRGRARARRASGAARSPAPCERSTTPASSSRTSRSAIPTLDDVFLTLTGRPPEEAEDRAMRTADAAR